jgi:transcription initiation factor TFIIH subunit 2
MSAFSHLVRFEAEDGKTYYGDLAKETPTRDIEGTEVEVLEGDVKSGFSKKGSKAKVSRLLCPLPTTNIIPCVGLNYRQHAEECNVGLVLQKYVCCINSLTKLSSRSPPTPLYS